MLLQDSKSIIVGVSEPTPCLVTVNQPDYVKLNGVRIVGDQFAAFQTVIIGAEQIPRGLVGSIASD